MYCDFYQMRERPFSVTADPRFLYLNARYREALASLHYGVTQRKGFITLIGEAGTGKTTLLKKLLDDLDPSTRTVFIFNTNVTFDEILEYLFGEFDLPVHNAKRLYMLQRLNSFLLEELRSGRNVALLIDEAQDLDFAVLEELRLLSNLETAKEKILQIVLSGQPELGQKLGNPILRQLRQRVAVNCRLLPLTRQELTEYIQSRLTAAGCADPRLFSRDAEERIFEISTGIPRLINIVCDNALVIGYALGKKRIGVDVVNEAAADLVSMDTSDFSVEAGNLGVTVAAQPVPRARIISQIGVVAAVVVALLIGLLSVGRSLLRREFGLLAGGTVQQAPLEVVAPGARMDAREKVRLRPVAPGGSRVVAGEDGVGRGLQREAGGEGRAAEERQRGALGMAEYPVPLDREGNRQRPAIGMQGEAGADAEREPVVLEVARRVPGLAEGDVAEAAEPLVSLPLQGIEPSSAVRAAATEDAETAASVEMEAVGAPQHEETGEMAAAPRGDTAEGPAQPSETMEEAAAALGAQIEERSALPSGTEEQVAAPLAGQSTGAATAVRKPMEEMPAASAEPVIELETVPGDERMGRPRDPSGGDGLRVALARFQKVRVGPGDSVSQIATDSYGQASNTILDLMKMANPAIRDIDIISVGQELQLPQLDEGLVLLREDDGDFALLLMSTPVESKANSIGEALRQRGFDARVGSADFGSGQTVWRVLIGDLKGREEALRVGKELQKLFREDGRIAAMGQ